VMVGMIFLNSLALLNLFLKIKKIEICRGWRGSGMLLGVSRRLKGYLRENWGSPFVVAFMALLMAAAGFLCAGSEGMANELAVYAYYSLVLGVVLQLVCYLRYGGEEE